MNVDVDHFYAADFFINNYQRLVFLSFSLLALFVADIFPFLYIFSMFYTSLARLSGADFNY